MTTPTRRFHVGIALDGAGFHPAAWREADADPAALFSAGYFVDLVQRAEAGGLDFVLVEDAFGVQDGGADRVRGRLDALEILARVAPVTTTIGLIPTVTTTHTEPFHVATKLATLDFVSAGRAGWHVAVSTSSADAALFGRKLAAPVDELLAEADEFIDVVRRLWDSWEDGAEIRDRPTGRFIDRDKLHYVDFEGKNFNVRGPSITPRSPQGQPLVVVDVETVGDAASISIAAERADIALVSASTVDAAAALRRELLDAARGHGRPDGDLAVLVDVDVLLRSTDADAASTRARLDGRAQRAASARLSYTGAAAGLADILDEWVSAGAADGFVLRPAVLPTDLAHIVDGLVPDLIRRGSLTAPSPGTTLRDHFGLARPASRYAVS